MRLLLSNSEAHNCSEDCYSLRSMSGLSTTDCVSVYPSETMSFVKIVGEIVDIITPWP
jgi:hypothetical protein